MYDEREAAQAGSTAHLFVGHEDATYFALCYGAADSAHSGPSGHSGGASKRPAASGQKAPTEDVLCTPLKQYVNCKYSLRSCHSLLTVEELITWICMIVRRAWFPTFSMSEI